jgi:hypothetical protein
MAKIMIAAFACLWAVTASAQICGPDVKHSTKRVESRSPLEMNPPSDKAVVYVLAPTYEAGSVQLKLSSDRVWIGVNQHHSYFVAALEPGEHELCSKSGSGRVSGYVARLTLKVEAGKTYYVLQHTTVQPFAVGSSDLTTVSAEDAAILLKKCKRMEFSEKK